MSLNDDTRYMKRALQLARRGIGRVSPNPLVGAVVVKDGAIVGEGYHLYEKKDHAETLALRAAGPLARGADLHLNLEPCSHFGRTPPCVDGVIEAGIRRVSLAMRDPNPLVSGQGIEALRRHGIEVREGICRDKALRLNEKFFHFIQTGRPFVLLKLALTLDGRVATASGESRWITGESARRIVHNWRFEYDALLVGVNTVLADDPSLDTRGTRQKPLMKVILDSGLRTPATARLFSTPGPVVICHGPDAPSARVSALQGKARLLIVPRTRTGIDWDCILRALGEQAISSLMIEGGGKVAASALAAGIVQKVAFFYAPKILGSEGARGIAGIETERLADAVRLDSMKVRRAGTDILVEGYPKASPPGPAQSPA